MFGQLVSFDNLVPPFPISVAIIFFFLQSHYIGILRSQSSSFTSGCNRWRQLCCITLCTVSGSTRNGLISICSCREMATLRMIRTPKNIGRKFWVQSVFIFVLIINCFNFWFIDLQSGSFNNVGCNFFKWWC